MTSASPFVSVIMPVYNGAKFLAKAVTSIRRKNTNGFQLTKVLKKSLDRRRARNNGLVHSLPKISNFDEAPILSHMVSE
jgi:glycosyltransferase involved in cell wall biosynthesis